MRPLERGHQAQQWSFRQDGAERDDRSIDKPRPDEGLAGFEGPPSDFRHSICIRSRDELEQSRLSDAAPLARMVSERRQG
jgi:hypothetical protein